MIKNVILLLFLCGIQYGSSNSLPQQATKTETVLKNGINKNEVGANGLENQSAEVLKNFRNPVLEYLLHKNSERTNGPPKKGIIREIRHSQTLLIPNFSGKFPPVPEYLLNQLPGFTALKKPNEEPTRDPENSPLDNFLNYLKNKQESQMNNTQESVVTSPVLHLNKKPEKSPQESTKIQVYPAVAVIINTYNKDGTLKNSVTHFQPDFNSVKADTNREEATYVGGNLNPDRNLKYTLGTHHTVNHIREKQQNEFQGVLQQQTRQGGTPWPFANYFPIVINDPFSSFYNAFSSSMYNAVSTMIEYGPEADVCKKDGSGDTLEPENSKKENIRKAVEEFNNRKKFPNFQQKNPSQLLSRFQRKEEEDELKDSSIFGEMTIRTESFKGPKKPVKLEDPFDNEQEKAKKLENLERKRRDTTLLFLKTTEGDKINVTLENPQTANNNQQKEKGKSDLILRRGGIAIVGPGGAATAYTGGTAIVGPYGTVYKSPEGVAILGPFSKIVNITDDTSFEEILKMHKEIQSENQPAVKSPLTVTDQQKTETGFKSYRNYFSYITQLPIKIDAEPRKKNVNRIRQDIVRLKEEDYVKTLEDIKKGGFRRTVKDMPVEEKVMKNNETTLIFRPKSRAEAGRNGVAVSAPRSHAILYPGQKAHIYFEPESVASAGPLGFAHAHSDLFVSYIQNVTTTTEPQTKTERNKRKSKIYNAEASTHDERARSFNPILLNTVALSTVLRPPPNENRKYLDYSDSKNGTKPSKPTKEENSSEEVGEEETSGQSESANEAVAISPPPEGASVAEAKPIGLAIAGPGGVAASKPQGTAVAGPGGLAIARPVGTAIAGVDVEGSVPIGGQQKNKKKPKQEQDQADTELHYVGGLTGPIGNPQPKEFADGLYKSVRETEGNNIQDSLFFRGRHNSQGFQLKLGQKDGKYGFVPMFSSPVERSERLQKRMDSPTFFHGLLGNDQGSEQIQNYEGQY